MVLVDIADSVAAARLSPKSETCTHTTHFPRFAFLQLSMTAIHRAPRHAVDPLRRQGLHAATWGHASLLVASANSCSNDDSYAAVKLD